MNEEMLLGAAVSHNEKSLLGSAKGMDQDFIASYTWDWGGAWMRLG